jgi:hypothetical protein
MNVTGMPKPIRELVGWLERDGFHMVEERSDDSYNQLRVLARGPCRIRILVDRGDWSIEIAPSSGEWMHPDVWEAYLDEFPLAGDLSNLEHQARFLEQRLPEIIQVAEQNPDAEAELLAMDEEYMRRWLGVGPES